jgi:radical SAM superfamily enzyme YgiQ (UPF0313 family)
MIFFFEKISKEISTKIVCFSCFSFESLKQSLILAKYIKKLDSKKIIVFGGIGTFNHEHSLMKEFTFIDFIIMRKSEQQLCELINLLYENKDFSKISNLVYRNSNKHIRSNKLATYNIESQSSPDYDFYFDIKKDWDIQYMTSDGCVNKCAFCSLTDNSPIYKSTKKITTDLKYLKSKYNSKCFSFQDDNINTNHKRTIELMNSIKNTDIKWYALSSANLMTKKIIRAMSSAGCRWIQFGLESGSNNILKLMNKPVNLKRFVEVMKNCVEVNIKPQLNIIMGYPGETESDVDKTLSYLKDNRKHFSHVNCYLYRLYFNSNIGVKLKKQYFNTSLLKQDVEKYNYFTNIDNRQHIDKYVSFLEKNSINYNSVFAPK